MTKPLIDISILEQQFGGDSEFLSEVVKDFQEQCINLSAQIHSALESGSLQQLSEHAHQLKGSLLVLGARMAADAAFEVEKVGHARQEDKAADAVAALRRALDTLAPELDRLARHGFGPGPT